jgi:hypothetical protein
MVSMSIEATNDRRAHLSPEAAAIELESVLHATLTAQGGIQILPIFPPR